MDDPIISHQATLAQAFETRVRQYGARAFLKDKRNKGLSSILHWLLEHKRRCEQQAYFSVNPRDPQMPEKIIVEKIKKGDYV